MTTAISNQTIECTIDIYSKLIPDFIGYARGMYDIAFTFGEGFGYDYVCLFQFQCPQDCECVLGNRSVRTICSSRLSVIPIHYNAPTNVTSFIWGNTGLTLIQPDAFADLKYIEKLDVSHNRITKLFKTQFDGLRKLQTLYLGFNRIDKLCEQQFKELNNLHTLLLNDNNIKDIHPKVFEGLGKLERLSLRFNEIIKLHPGQFIEIPRLTFLYLSDNKVSELHLHHIDGLHNLKDLNVDNNKIKNIQPDLFTGFVNLTWLSLRGNFITKIHPRQFEGLSQLYSLNLNFNRVAKLEPTQFKGLSNLSEIRLGYNKISDLHPLLFKGLSLIWELRLSGNNIETLPKDLFQFDLFFMYLDHNRIVELHPQQFRTLTRLLVLHLQNNQIEIIHASHFETLGYLSYLDLGRNNLMELSLPSQPVLSNLGYLSLASNRLHHFYSGTFANFPNLRYLNLSDNNIDTFNSRLLFNSSIVQIEITDLRKNKLYSVNQESFEMFNYSVLILVDNEATCCFIKAANCSATVPKSQFLTCDKLMPNQFQKITMWILAFAAIVSNIYVLYYRIKNKSPNRVQIFLIANLSLSDLFMGIYMIIIVSADSYYSDYFPSEAWRKSITCKLAGTMSFLSSEASVFFVTLISIDRFMGIRYPFSVYRFGVKSTWVWALILWTSAVVLSIVSTIISEVNPDLYDVSEVCTGLPLSRSNVFERKHAQYDLGTGFTTDADGFSVDLIIDNYYDIVTGSKPGMYFGIAVFTVFNLLCFLTVFICYTGIFFTAVQTAKRAGRVRNAKGERKMAIKMGAIVLTDLACWLPIIALSLLVQSGRYVVTPDVYTWIVTFVLPINSAINPFLYTLANVVFDGIQNFQSRQA